MRAISTYVRRHHVALLGLFIALGGTSYAAVKLPRNSVGPKQIKAGAVGSSEVKNRSLRANDLRRGVLRRGPTGAQGAQGPRGAQGPPGPTAASFASVDPADLTFRLGVTKTVALSDGQGPIRVPFNSRLLANASLSLAGATTNATTLRCRAELAPAGTGAFTTISQPADLDLASTERVQVPVAGAANVAPGTYDVRVVCFVLSGGDVTFRHGDLTVVAAAR